MRLGWLLMCCGVGGLIGGCGQKGPLILPDAHPRTPVIAKPASPPTPAPTTKDRPTGAVQ